jgi:hypothetical protein
VGGLIKQKKKNWDTLFYCAGDRAALFSGVILVTGSWCLLEHLSSRFNQAASTLYHVVTRLDLPGPGGG